MEIAGLVLELAEPIVAALAVAVVVATDGHYLLAAADNVAPMELLTQS